MEVRGDGSYRGTSFGHARAALLPNETVGFVARQKSGFLVLSDRRLVHLEEDSGLFKISHTIPVDLVMEIRQKNKDTWEIVYHETDGDDGSVKARLKDGSVQYSTGSLEVKQPAESSLERYSATMSEFNFVLKDILQNPPYSDQTFTTRDCSYLHTLIRPQTPEEILHLNLGFFNRSETDRLPRVFLDVFGESPYILWDTIAGAHAFVVGKRKSAYVLGVYKDRILYASALTVFDDSDMLAITSRWMSSTPASPKLILQYVFGEKRVLKTDDFSWVPTGASVPSKEQWFGEPGNAPWIIADMILDQQGKPVRANYFRENLVKDPFVMRQRYY